MVHASMIRMQSFPARSLEANIEMNPYHEIATAFSEKPHLTRRELKDYFKSNNPALKESSLDWLVYNLNQKHIIQRVGYDRYRACTESAPSKEYSASLSGDASAVLAFIEKRFPLLSS